MTEKTKMQRAIEAIFAKPGIRTQELEEVADMAPGSSYALMSPVIKAGLIVTCKVASPGKSSQTEYRPSAAAPAKAPDWKLWKAQHAERTERCVETQAGSGANNPGRCAPATPVGQVPPPAGGASVVETQAERVMASEESGATPAALRPAVSDVTPHEPADLVHLMIANDGSLHIEAGDQTLILSASHTRALGEFLHHVQPVWKQPDWTRTALAS